MYESPINQILGEMQTTYENECMKVVQSVGFDVNKEELTKALQYDRNQYEKGYADGYAKAIDDAIKASVNAICVGCGYLDGYKCNYKGANCGVSKPMLESVIKALEQMKGAVQ